MEFTTERKSAGDGGKAAAITLSVIIASFNTRELLANCLQSIYRNPPGEPFEIIVVDDASMDGTSEMVRARFPGVRLLLNEINRSYAFSNNRGIRPSPRAIPAAAEQRHAGPAAVARPHDCPFKDSPRGRRCRLQAAQ